jgi:bacteriorhodopsin
MRIAGNIVGIILVLLGGIWMAQGSNLLAGSAMSGQSMWLWIGVAVALIGLIVLVWTNRRR